MTQEPPETRRAGEPCVGIALTAAHATFAAYSAGHSEQSHSVAWSLLETFFAATREKRAPAVRSLLSSMIGWGVGFESELDVPFSYEEPVGDRAPRFGDPDGPFKRRLAVGDALSGCFHPTVLRSRRRLRRLGSRQSAAVVAKALVDGLQPTLARLPLGTSNSKATVVVDRAIPRPVLAEIASFLSSEFRDARIALPEEAVVALLMSMHGDFGKIDKSLVTELTSELLSRVDEPESRLLLSRGAALLGGCDSPHTPELQFGLLREDGTFVVPDAESKVHVGAWWACPLDVCASDPELRLALLRSEYSAAGEIEAITIDELELPAAGQRLDFVIARIDGERNTLTWGIPASDGRLLRPHVCRWRAESLIGL